VFFEICKTVVGQNKEITKRKREVFGQLLRISTIPKQFFYDYFRLVFAPAVFFGRTGFRFFCFLDRAIFVRPGLDFHFSGPRKITRKSHENQKTIFCEKGYQNIRQ
jgi:hypothetical protein